VTYQDVLVLVLVLVSVKAHLRLDIDDFAWSGDSGVVSRCWQKICLSE